MAKKILVVDDEKQIRRLIEITLKRVGYDVVTAADGVEALSAIDTHHPDMLVLDWMMPKLSGIEVLKRLQMNPNTKDLPVIMLTAKAGDADVLKGWQSGVYCYLTKPFNPLELLAFTKRILSDDPVDEEDEERIEI